MRHVWTVVCQQSLEDKKSNNYSLIETLNRVSFKGDIPPERPVNLPFTYHVVSQWIRSNEYDNHLYPARLRILSPENDELVAAEITVNLKEHDNFRTRFGIDTFRYTENGIYEFEMSYLQGDDWIVATLVPLKVTHEESVPDEESESVE